MVGPDRNSSNTDHYYTSGLLAAMGGRHPTLAIVQARRLGGALGARALSPDPFTEEVRDSRQKDSEGCVETPKYVPDIWLSCLLPDNVEKCVFVTVTLDGTVSGKR